MKIWVISIFLLIFFCGTTNAQTLPIDFETEVTTENFVDFDGGTASVIDNPQPNGINTSSKVAQIVRNGGQIWAGSKIDLPQNLNFTELNTLSMKVFTTAPIGTIVKFKLEGNGETERDTPTTVTNEWETLTWDFTGAPSNFNSLVFMFDFGNLGDGSSTSTFLFDDVEQLFGGLQIDLPVDFESTNVNYTTTDFGGNVSSLVPDPTNPNNTVVQAIKTDGAALWAGTTIGTNAGFATNIPLTLEDSKMTVKIWSPDSGIPIRLKVEDSNDPTRTCETETITTVSEDWEYLTFDFNNQAPGTAALSDGLQMGWTYNMASIFFNFGTEGIIAGEKTYYFDDVNFGEIPLNTYNLQIATINVFPNPSNSFWNINSTTSNIASIEIFDIQGKLLYTVNPNSSKTTINATNFAPGIYLSKIVTLNGTSIVKLFKQ